LITKLLGLIASLVLLGVSQAGAATFTLKGVGYTDGSLSGSFAYDSGAYSNVNITATGGIFDGDNFDLLGSSSTTQLNADSANGDSLTLAFASSLPTNGGSDGVTGDQLIQANTEVSVLVNDAGSVQAPAVALPPTTPLPAALPLFATGLSALGLLGWRRKRKAAASLAAA
jgi:hypothetical protein